MTLANPVALWLLTALVPVIALHLLRPRRVDTVVSSGLLWEPDTAGATAAQPWQKLTPTPSLFLQILAVLLATLALANPVVRSEAELAAHTVVVLDASASMTALDGSPERLGDAKNIASSIFDELPAGGTISLVAGGPTPRVAVTSTDDRDTFDSALAAVKATEGPFDLASAMTLADGLETAEQTIGIVLISDGRHGSDALRSLPPGVTHRIVGRSGVNRAITNLSVTADVADEAPVLRAVATIEVTGGPEASFPVRFDVDGATAAVEDVTVTPDQPATVEVLLPVGDRVVARFSGDDLLAVDDSAYAVARTTEQVTVRIEGTADPFVDTLIDSLPGVRRIDSAEELADVVVFVDAPVPADITTPFWAIAPVGGFAGVTPGGVVDAPVPTLLRTTDPLLVGLDLSDLRVAEAQRVDAPTAETLVGAEGAPLLLRGRRGGLPFIYSTFELGRSSLPLDVSFPVLGDRILQELAGSGIVPRALNVGDELRPPAGRSATVVSPSGTTVNLAVGSGSVTIDEPGFWELRAEDARTVTIAANLPGDESDLEPLPVAPSEPRTLRSGESPPTSDRSFRWLALLALVAVVLVEWWYWLPRAGVPRWQRRTANGLRIAAVAALLASLLGVSLPLPTREVATVFVVDRSDSLGARGRLQALEWAEAATVDRIDDRGTARSGVVFSADGARVDRLLRDRERLGASTLVEIDGDRTDLAAGLRLAGALLPDDARRRIVVLSDGRVTSGDAMAEAEALAARDVVIDYSLIDSSTGGDASISAVRAPASVDEGESVVIEAEVFSTEAQPALVTLRRDGEVVGTTEVELTEGTSVISLRDTPPSGGLAAYDVSVQVALDDQPRNDVGRVAVDVAGLSRVLIVDGTDAGAGPLVDALESSGLIIDRVLPGAVPDLTGLASYESVVLVDVDAAMLSEQQMLDLVANTRDLGRGLVTIGGPTSYGMGSYLDSTLEQALPVVSDVLDPRRRRTIAEVFALDTSESMGNCHCAENGAPTDRLAGGVNKTDIARAGAARAIASLTADDEIGLLAVDTSTEWLLDVQPLPDDDVIAERLSLVTPRGNTDLRSTLTDAAEQLRASDAGLKHIILFTDGFTPPDSMLALRNDAAALFDEGITVSVVGTGEGAARELQAIATAGGGRFYPGRDLARIPEILVQESIIASRSFINEGEFFPTLTARSPVTSGITATPALTGFVATTAKPTATTVMVIGEEDDPLLATWRTGLGRATSWTSDVGSRWATGWSGWDQAPEFWTRLVRETFPLESGGAVRATVDGDRVEVRVETESAGGAVIATVTDPDGRRRDVDLTEVRAGVFVGEVSTGSAGTYAVAAGRVDADAATADITAIGADLATLSYPAEYRPGSPNEALLAALSQATGGRGAIDPPQAFDGEGLASTTRRVPLAGWLLTIGVVAWLASLVFSRLWIRRGRRSPTTTSAATTSTATASTAATSTPGTAAASTGDAPTSGDAQPASPPGRSRSRGRPPGRRSRTDDADSEQDTLDSTPAPPPDPDAEPAAPSSMEQLLRAKRDRK